MLEKTSGMSLGTATRARQSDYTADSKILPNLTDQILLTWEFYPPTRPHIVPKCKRLGENFITATLQLVSYNDPLANYSSNLAISSNRGIVQNVSQIILLVSNNKLNPFLCLLSCHCAQQKH